MGFWSPRLSWKPPTRVSEKDPWAVGTVSRSLVPLTRESLQALTQCPAPSSFSVTATVVELMMSDAFGGLSGAN